MRFFLSCHFHTYLLHIFSNLWRTFEIEVVSSPYRQILWFSSECFVHEYGKVFTWRRRLLQRILWFYHVAFGKCTNKMWFKNSLSLLIRLEWGCSFFFFFNIGIQPIYLLWYTGSNLEAITTCELCKEKLHLNIENFDINELYRSHERVSASKQDTSTLFSLLIRNILMWYACI